MNILTFTTTVDTFKRNFFLKKLRFNARKKDYQDRKRVSREEKIEQDKFFSNYAKRAGDKVKQTSGNILDNVIKFAAFTLLGFITKNIGRIAQAAAKILKTIKEIIPKVKEFVKNFKPLFESFLRIASLKAITDLKPLKTFGSLLGKVTKGIIRIANKIGNRFIRIGGGSAAAGTTLPVKPSGGSKVPVRDVVKSFTRQPTPVVRPAPVPTAVPAQPRVPVGAGSGLGSGTRTGTSTGLIDPVQSKNIDKAARLKFQQFADALENLKETTGGRSAKDIDLEKFIRATQEGGRPVDPMLTGAAGDRAARQAGVLPAEELVGGKPRSAPKVSPELAKIRLKADLAAAGIQIDEPGSKMSQQVAKELQNVKPKPNPVVRGVLNKLKFIGTTFKILGLILLYKELEADYKRGDYYAIVVKLTAAGLGSLAVLAANAVGVKIAIATGGAGLPATIGIGAASLGAGVATDLSIRQLGFNLRDMFFPDEPKTTERKTDKRGRLIREKQSSVQELRDDPELEKLEFPERNADDPFVYDDGSVLKPGDIISRGVNRSEGLNGQTTYGQGSFVALRQNFIAIQPIEVPVG